MAEDGWMCLTMERRAAAASRGTPEHMDRSSTMAERDSGHTEAGATKADAEPRQLDWRGGAADWRPYQVRRSLHCQQSLVYDTLSSMSDNAG
jgi:hypothetical protein